MAPPSPPQSGVAAIFTNLHEIYLDNVLPWLPAPVQQVSNGIDNLITPILMPLFTSGDLVSLAAFLVCVYFTLRIADYIRRSIIGWLFFFIKLGLILLAVQTFFYVQTYGWDKALRDAGWLGGMVWGFVEQAYNQADNNKKSAGKGYPGGRDGKGWNVSGGRQQVPGGARHGRWV